MKHPLEYYAYIYSFYPNYTGVVGSALWCTVKAAKLIVFLFIEYN